jgi:hypothetical protein
MQLLMQQGLAIDWKEYAKLKAELLGIPEFKRILIDTTSPPDPEEGEVANTGAPRPQQTTRQYDRVVKPQGGPSQQVGDLISSMSPARTMGQGA